MYSVSTQKQNWTFQSLDELDQLRISANAKHINRFKSVLAERPDIANDDFLNAREEAVICRIVSESGIRFGDDFKPEMWPSVRWIAFSYFKRFYLRESAMEYYPKNVMMGCYYLAAKVDEFNISIDNFIDNLRNGTRQYNTETIMTLEPDIMLKLDYNLTVHTPYRPFEGHLIEMKTKIARQLSEIEFDLESIRPMSSEFLKNSLLSDAMFLYSPSQMALAAVKFGMDKALGEVRSSTLMLDFLACLLDVDLGDAGSKGSADILQLEKLQKKARAFRPSFWPTHKKKKQSSILYKTVHN
uniref:Cyclin-H n=1 Tax=Globodera rostochiensis TaxID=31243 RepID=A0A914IDE1_GLORO